MSIPIRATSWTALGCQVINATTGAPFVGTVTVYVQKDGSAQAIASVNSGVATAAGNGTYTIDLTATETDAVLVKLTFIGTGAVSGLVEVPTISTTQQQAVGRATGTITSQTALGIITDAMVEIGAYSPGEAISAAHAQLGLLRFQNQLNAWQADALTLNLQEREIFTLTAGTSTFTIGPGGDLSVTRPVNIEGVNYLIPGTSTATEVPMGPMDNDQFMALSQKGLSSSLPQQYYYNNTFTPAAPWGEMFIWPTVSQTVNIVLYLPRGVDVPASLATFVGGPQGYAEAFMYQLALRLCRPMARPVDPELALMVREVTANMKRQNVDPGLLGVDAALVPMSGGGYNILADTTTGSSNR